MFPSSDAGGSCLALGQHNDVPCKGYSSLQRKPPTPADRAGMTTVICKQHPPPHVSPFHASSVKPQLSLMSFSHSVAYTTH